MRKLLVLMAMTLALGFATMHAQEAEQPKKYYMEVTGEVMPGNRINISFNLGRVVSQMAHIGEGEVSKVVRTLHFSSMVDAMNYLSINGWALEQCYTTSLPNRSTINWVVSKSVLDPHELLDGLIPKN